MTISRGIRYRTVTLWDKNLKDCSRCREFKSFDKFYVRNNGMLTSYCKACECIRTKSLYDPKIRKEKYGESDKIRIKKYIADVKFEIMSHYGSCYCCDENRVEFLTIDHINGGGNKHRKEIGRIGYRFYLWLKKNNYPDGFRSACMNCNMATRYGNICPHKMENV